MELQLKARDEEIANQTAQILNMNKEIYALEKKTPSQRAFGFGGVFDKEMIESIDDISCHKQYKELLSKLTEKNRYLAIVDEEITLERKRNDGLTYELKSCRETVQKVDRQLKKSELLKQRLKGDLEEQDDTIQALEEHLREIQALHKNEKYQLE
jgi:septal ring factor EnvC (AmiA/AmiB activator)